jgi:hypothetical protein
MVMVVTPQVLLSSKPPHQELMVDVDQLAELQDQVLFQAMMHGRVR